MENNIFSELDNYVYDLGIVYDGADMLQQLMGSREFSEDQLISLATLVKERLAGLVKEMEELRDKYKGT